MNYLEIIGKNLVDGKNAQDYIDWAVAKLENGFETESIIALVSLILESFPEIGLAEKYFHASIGELGLPYPDSKKAIFAYLQFFCDEVLGGKIQPELAVNILKNICETISDNTVFDGVYHPIMDIWYYLDEDLYMLSIDEFSMFNIGLNLLNIDGYILQVIHQFQYMLSLNLPINFMELSINQQNIMWDMRGYEGRVLYLEKINQNLIFNP